MGTVARCGLVGLAAAGGVLAFAVAPAISGGPLVHLVQQPEAHAAVRASVPVIALPAESAAPLRDASDQTGLLAGSDGPAAASDATASAVEQPETEGIAAGLRELPRQAVPIRIPRPTVPEGPRRIGLQVGHWRTDEAPEELRRLVPQTGTSWGGVAEWQLNLDVSNRVAALLRARGHLVDVLPTTIPNGYLADVFLALHADGDPDGVARGYKAAHGSRRGPYEDQLVRHLVAEYGNVTGLPLDSRVSRNMLGYYAFSWTRFQATVAPHTPAAILEMGFMTSAADRAVLLQRQDIVAAGIANGILRFLDEVPTGAAFAEDLIVPPLPPRPPLAPGATLG